MSMKRSSIWDYFKVGEDTKFAIYNACGPVDFTWRQNHKDAQHNIARRAAFRVTEEVRRKNKGKGKCSNFSFGSCINVKMVLCC